MDARSDRRANYGWCTRAARLLSVTRLARSTGWRLRRVGRQVRGWTLTPRPSACQQSLLGGSHDSSNPSPQSDPPHRISCPNRSGAIRGAALMNPESSASRSYHSPLLSCPRCGLSITPKVDWLAIEHCPRCLARARVAVTLSSSPPTGEPLHRQHRALRADRPGTPGVDRSRRR